MRKETLTFDVKYGTLGEKKKKYDYLTAKVTLVIRHSIKFPPKFEISNHAYFNGEEYEIDMYSKSNKTPSIIPVKENMETIAAKQVAKSFCNWREFCTNSKVLELEVNIVRINGLENMAVVYVDNVKVEKVQYEINRSPILFDQLTDGDEVSA